VAANRIARVDIVVGARPTRTWVRVGVATALAWLAVGATALEAAEPEERPRPNVVVVLSDDQPFESLQRMPYVSGRDDWISFENAFINTPLCCPSRATLLNGRYSHHNDVVTNLDGENFDDRSTLATWLQDAGYRTAFIGKYLNGYPWSRRDGRYIPPGWTRWTAFRGLPGYYDYRLNVSGPGRGHARTVETGSEAEDYSTDLLTRKEVSFLGRAAPRRDPFLLVYAPYAPHGPFVPAPPYEQAFAGTPVYEPPSLNEADLSDKPAWLQGSEPVDPEDVAERRRLQYRMLLSLDDGVRALFEELKAQRALRDTAVIFLSDNGFSWGEHRYVGKACAYEECIDTPLLVRYPGLEPRSEDALVSNIDLAPTIARWAEARLPRNVDGASLGPLLRERRSRLHDAVLIHAKPASGHDASRAPLFWGVRTQRFKYVETPGSAEVELYDLVGDPYELRNVAAQPAYASVVADLAARLRELRGY
jgi:arylsulfatase A-like enzyme